MCFLGLNNCGNGAGQRPQSTEDVSSWLTQIPLLKYFMLLFKVLRAKPSFTAVPFQDPWWNQSVSATTTMQPTVLLGLHINSDITCNDGCIVTERGRTRSVWRSLVTGQAELTQPCVWLGSCEHHGGCEIFWWHPYSQKGKQSLHEELPPWTQTSLLVKTVPCQHPSQLSSKLNYRG